MRVVWCVLCLLNLPALERGGVAWREFGLGEDLAFLRDGRNGGGEINGCGGRGDFLGAFFTFSDRRSNTGHAQ